MLLAQYLAGFVVWLVAAGVLYAVGAAHGAAGDGVVLAVLVLVVLPMLLTAWFVRAYRKLDPQVRWAANLPGITFLVAATALLSLLLFARGLLASSLDAVLARHPALEAPLGQPLRALAAFLRPAPPAPSTPPAAPSAAPAPSSAAPAPAAPSSAGPSPASSPTQPRADVLPVIPPDPTATGPAGSPSAAPPSDTAPSSPFVFDPCHGSSLYRIAALPQRVGVPDRIWAGCLGPEGSVYQLRPDGTVSQRATITLAPKPAPLQAFVGDAFSADLDRDGTADLVVGFQYSDGLIRDGGVLWARALQDGTYAPLQRIIAINSSSYSVADLDGKPGVEIVVVDYGNPFDQQHPQGRLLVYQLQGSRWQQVSSMLVPQEPESLRLADVDGDGRLDAVIEHDLPGGPDTRVYLGRGLSFAAADPTRHADRHDPKAALAADLDGDGQRDDQIAFGEEVKTDPEGNRQLVRGLALQRRRPLRAVVQNEAQALPYPAAAH